MGLIRRAGGVRSHRAVASGVRGGPCWEAAAPAGDWRWRADGQGGRACAAGMGYGTAARSPALRDLDDLVTAGAVDRSRASAAWWRRGCSPTCWTLARRRQGGFEPHRGRALDAQGVQRKGRSFVRGSRPRRMLCLAAVSAASTSRTSPKYRELRDRGWPPKVALTAVMRWLVVLANAFVKQDRELDARARWCDRSSPAMAGATGCRSGPILTLGTVAGWWRPPVRPCGPPPDKMHTKTVSEERTSSTAWTAAQARQLATWILTLRWMTLGSLKRRRRAIIVAP